MMCIESLERRLCLSADIALHSRTLMITAQELGARDDSIVIRVVDRDGNPAASIDAAENYQILVDQAPAARGTFAIRAVQRVRVKVGGGNDAVLFEPPTGFAFPALAGDVDGGNGNDMLSAAGAGKWKLRGGRGDDTIFGADGNDLLDGGAGNDTLWGGNGRDLLRGGAGNDLVRGSNGNDRLIGGAGNDDLDGGLGKDQIAGGAGDDTIEHDSNDGRRLSPGSGANVIIETRPDNAELARDDDLERLTAG